MRKSLIVIIAAMSFIVFSADRPGRQTLSRERVWLRETRVQMGVAM